jgi:hypothetical protein
MTQRGVLYNIIIEFGILMKLVRLIKMGLNENLCRIVCIGMYNAFPIQNDLKEFDALSPLLFNFSFEYTIRKVQEN